MTAYNAFYKQALTGGTDTALDAISVDSLNDGDIAQVMAGGYLYVYQFDATATDAESSPTIIRPDDYSTAGVWKQQISPLDNPNPTGTVIIWPTSTVPTGYLECNGQAVSRTGANAALYALLGDTYGAGDGTTTFNLPNYVGEFLRGYDSAGTVDPDTASRTDPDGSATTSNVVGSRQADELEAHTHEQRYTGAGAQSAGYDMTNGDGVWTSIATGSTGGSETRGRNVAVKYCIKQ